MAILPLASSAAVSPHDTDGTTHDPAACLPSIPALLEAPSLFWLGLCNIAMQPISVTLPVGTQTGWSEHWEAVHVVVGRLGGAECGEGAPITVCFRPEEMECEGSQGAAARQQCWSTRMDA